MNSVEPRLLGQLHSAAEHLEHASPHEILSWAFENFREVVMACSFEDAALLHMVHEVAPQAPVVFLDTGGHFPQTLDFVARLEREWGLRLVRTRAATDSPVCGSPGCCAARKVEPLRQALVGRDAWITSLKRVDSPTRSHVPVVAWDEKFSLVKLNPLATWSDEDVAYYLGAHGLAEHPLWAQGYTSIGCAAVTQKPLDGTDRRSGRWAGSTTVECGLHEA